MTERLPVDAPHYLTVGGLREDYFITADRQVHLHKLGGNAVYSAVGARLWASADKSGVHIVSRVGENYPQEWFERIEQYHIGTQYIIRTPGPQDMRTFYAYLSENERLDSDPRKFFRELGQPLPDALQDYIGSTVGQEDSSTRFAPLAVRPGDVRFAEHMKVVGAHLAPDFFVTHRTLPSALRLAQVKTITLDPSIRYMTPDKEREVREIVAGLDAFMPSEQEVLNFYRRREVDWWEAAEQFGSWGAKVVVIKQGPKGQLLYDRVNKKRWRIPAYPVTVMDVTGAGDAYCGAFMVALAETGDPVEAGVRACVSAAIAIEGLGALFALDSHPALAQARVRTWRSEVRSV